MAKRRPSLNVEQKDNVFSFTEVTRNYKVYHGKVYCLSNSQTEYAVIFDQQIPAISGPSTQNQQLLRGGECSTYENHERFLSELTEMVVREQAARLAKEKGLALKFSQSKPKCTVEEKTFPFPHEDPNSPEYNPFQKGGDNPNPHIKY